MVFAGLAAPVPVHLFAGWMGPEDASVYQATLIVPVAETTVEESGWVMADDFLVLPAYGFTQVGWIWGPAVGPVPEVFAFTDLVPDANGRQCKTRWSYGPRPGPRSATDRPGYPLRRHV
jgi:hypothetical protein